MKSLEEYRKEIEQDPKARRRLKKLEKEFQQVEDSLTEEELVKYGLKPAQDDVDPKDRPDPSDAASGDDAAGNDGTSDNDDAAGNDAANDVLDSIARKMF